MTWWYLDDDEVALTPEIATEVMIEMSDPRSSHFAKMRHETLPADHLFGRRLEMLTLAVMSQLRAKRQLAPDRARVDLRRRARHRARPPGGRVLRRAPAGGGPARRRVTAARGPLAHRCARLGPGDRLRARRDERRAVVGPRARRDRPARRRRRAGVHPLQRPAGLRAVSRPAAGGRQRPAVRHRARHPGRDRVGDARRRDRVLHRALRRPRRGRRRSPASGWRRAGVDRAARLLGRALRADRARRAVLARQLRRGPDPCLAAGLRGGRPRSAAPAAFAYTALGGSLDDLTSPEAIVAVVALVVMALAGVVLLRAERGRAAAAGSQAH